MKFEELLQWGRSGKLRKTKRHSSRRAGIPGASMGPERKAPENSPVLPARQPPRACFNGAGAESSGKRLCPFFLFFLASCFNGAGAESSGKLVGSALDAAKRSGFNGAGAESSGKLRDREIRGIRSRNASMGPERKAPENERYADRHRTGIDIGFNGAGAESSGKRITELEVPGMESMASMGPERKAPENHICDGHPGDFKTKLQWGRSGKLRKTPTMTALPFSQSAASMGPERKAPENQNSRSETDRTSRLQWGRSGKLRKTACFRRPMNRGFGPCFASVPLFGRQNGNFVPQSAWVVKQYFQYFKELTRMRASPGKMRSPSRSKRIGGKKTHGNFFEMIGNMVSQWRWQGASRFACRMVGIRGQRRYWHPAWGCPVFHSVANSAALGFSAEP